MTKNKESFGDKGSEYQQKVVQALFEDHTWAEQMYDIMDESFFTEAYLAAIIRMLYDYYKDYQVFPSISTFAALLKEKMQSGEKVVIKQIVNYLVEIKKNPLANDAPIIKDNALTFCKHKAMENAIIEIAHDLGGESFDDEAIVKKLQNAIQLGQPVDIGHDYAHEMEKRHEFIKRNSMPTGWPELDAKNALNGGISSGQLGVIMAPSGVGKSIMLVNLAANALRAGKNVVYYSLELSESKVGVRFDANFSGVGQNDVPLQKNVIMNALQEHCKGTLYIKYYPAYQMTLGVIRAHLKKLENKGFVPDLILVDYADLMAQEVPNYKGAKSYEGQGNNYVLLRAFGGEIGVPIWTAVQTNRGGVDKDLLSSSDISEDFKKVMHSDIILGLSRNDEDRKNGLARVKIVKNRDGVDGYYFSALLDTSTTIMSLQKMCEPEQIEAGSSKSAYKSAGNDKVTIKALSEFFKNKELTREED